MASAHDLENYLSQSFAVHVLIGVGADMTPDVLSSLGQNINGRDVQSRLHGSLL